MNGETTIPIAIALRKEFSDSRFRDTFIRALNSPEIDCAYIASGFFSDFTGRLEETAPDFGIGDGMIGKELFLLGGYGDSDASLCTLRDELCKRGLKVHVNRLAPPEPSELKLRWHAKVAIYISHERPVLAVVGSSNFTSPSMYGDSEWKFTAAPNPIQVEADSFYWIHSHMDAAQAMHDVFYNWTGGQGRPRIAFDNDKFDSEIAKLIDSLYRDLLSYRWRTV